jgi:hypothetical protein
VSSGLDFPVANLNNLQTDYLIKSGQCGLGSPRFQEYLYNPVANADGSHTQGWIFSYLGPPPNYNNCVIGSWQSSGNLAAPGNFVDDSQLPGGTFYDTWGSMQTKYGGFIVTQIILGSDYDQTSNGGGAGAPLWIDFDNTQIGSKSYGYQ